MPNILVSPLQSSPVKCVIIPFSDVQSETKKNSYLLTTTDIIKNGLGMRLQVYLSPSANASQMWFSDQQHWHHLETVRLANS